MPGALRGRVLRCAVVTSQSRCDFRGARGVRRGNCRFEIVGILTSPSRLRRRAGRDGGEVSGRAAPWRASALHAHRHHRDAHRNQCEPSGSDRWRPAFWQLLDHSHPRLGDGCGRWPRAPGNQGVVSPPMFWSRPPARGSGRRSTSPLT